MNSLNFIFLQAQQQGSSWSFLIMLLLIFVVMYVFMILPEKKRRKELTKFRESLKVGDPVMTIGGIYGKVAKINEKTILLEVDNNVKIKIDKNSIVREPGEIQK